MTRGRLFMAMVLNLLALPGAGQMSVKKRARGLIFLVLVVGVLTAFLFQLSAIIKTEVATFDYSKLTHLQNVDQSTQALELLKISQVLSQNIWQNHAFAFRIYVFLLGAIYIVSCLDLILIYWDTNEKNHG